MNITIIRKCALALAVSISTCPANADEALLEDSLWELSPEELGQVRLTSIATGTATPLDKSAAVATVITEEDIKAMGATDLDEVLETVPGLHVTRSDQTLTPRYIFRGITSARNPQTLTLVNGIPLTTLAFGNRSNVWGGMPLKSIARIEVIRGPGSALYGADAFSGVINIITKGRKDINGTEVGGRLGSFDTQAAWLLHGGTYNDIDTAFTLEYVTTDGHQEIISQDAQTALDREFGTNASLAPGEINKGVKMLESRLELEAGDLQFRAGYQGRFDLQSGPGIAQALDPNGRFRSDRINADLTHTYNPVDPWTIVSQASYFYGTQEPTEDNYIFPPGVDFTAIGGGSFPDGFIGNPGFKEEHARLSFSGIYSGFNSHRIRVGTGAFWGDIFEVTETKNFFPNNTPRPTGITSVADTDEVWLPEKDRYSFFAYLQDEWQFANDWQLTSGLRYDHYSDFGDTLNPRLALIWATTDNFTSKLLYGRAFRAPSIEELFVTSNPVALGNPELDPETIDTVELAFAYHPAPEVQYGLNLFYYRIDDYITQVPTGSGANQSQNERKRKGRGGEFEVTYRVLPNWQLLGNYAYQRSTDEDTGKDVGDAPNHQIYGRSEWVINSSWRLDTQVTWVGEQKRVQEDSRAPLDDYTTVDLTLRHYKAIEGLELALSARNLFDADVREASPGPNVQVPEDFPMPGRSIYGEIQYNF